MLKSPETPDNISVLEEILIEKFKQLSNYSTSLIDANDTEPEQVCNVMRCMLDIYREFSNKEHSFEGLI